MSSVANKVVAAKILTSLWDNAQFSDLTIRLSDGVEIKAHKCILAGCEFFARACTSGFKVSQYLQWYMLLLRSYRQESHEGVIEFPEDDPQAMRGFLMLFYGSTIEEMRFHCQKQPYIIPASVTYLVDLYDMTLKYDVKTFQHSIEQYLRNREAQVVAVGILDKKWCWELADRVYNRAGDHDYSTLKKIVLTQFGSQVDRLIVVLGEARLRELLADIPGLAIDLLLDGRLVMK